MMVMIWEEPSMMVLWGVEVVGGGELMVVVLVVVMEGGFASPEI